MTATVTPTVRKTYGIHHTIWIARCPQCHWRTELPNEPLALALSTNHRCARTWE